MTNINVIQSFYAAFQNQDAVTMNQQYHPQATFTDPVFGRLESWQAQAMWSMLCERAKDLQISFSNIQADEHTGQAHWEAYYTFSKTGNHIHNRIQASFKFSEGKIIEHVDQFSLWRWAGMALGMKGKLLGWAPFVKNRIRQEAQSGLQMYIKRKRLGPHS